MSNVQYTFENGLTIERQILSDGPSRSQDLYVPGEAFHPQPLEEAQPLVFETFGSERHHVAAQVTRRYAGSLVIHAQAWGGTVENPVTAHEARRFNQAHGLRSIMHLTMPGHGHEHPSSHWPHSVRSHMLTGSFIRAGQYLGDILRTTPDVEQARTIDILGTSTGGRSAIGLASSLGKYVRNLIIFDAPGSRKMSYKNFQHQFGVQEAQHGARYVSGSHDEQFQAIMRAAPSRASIDYMRRFARRDPIAAYDFYVSEIFGMSRGKLLNDLLQSDLSLVRRVVFLSPDRSELNNPEDVAGALKQAQAEHPHTVFEHYLLNGTHVMPRATSTMMSWLTKAAIAPEVFQK